MSEELTAPRSDAVQSRMDELRPRKTIPESLLQARINTAARGLQSQGDYSGSFAECRQRLTLLVETEDPENDSMLQLLLFKELAWSRHIEYMRRSSDFGESDERQLSHLNTALKFAKLHLQYQSVYEKAQRKGVQKIILQNNGPVSGQTIFGDARSETPTKTIDASERSGTANIRQRRRPNE